MCQISLNTEALLKLVEEGQAQGEIQEGLSQEALGIYFGAFVDTLAPQLQHRFVADPQLGSLRP